MRALSRGVDTGPEKSIMESRMGGIKHLEEGVEFIIQYTTKGSFNNIVDARTPEEMEELKRATTVPKAATSSDDVAHEAMRLLVQLAGLVDKYKGA